MQRRRTLSGSSGLTIRSLGKTHPSSPLSGRVAIQAFSRSKISAPMPTSRISLVLVGLISPLIAPVPRPLNSGRSQLVQIAVFQSISLRFSQPAESHQIARQSLSFVENAPRLQILRQRHTPEA